jgi:uncharacterized membrane protein
VNASTLRRWAYRLSALLALVYVVYVVGLKFAHRVTGGPLGELGEFGIVLVSVTALAVGLFADERMREAQRSGDAIDR